MDIDRPQWRLARKHRSSLLVAIIVLGSALRLYGLASRSLWYDEGATMRIAEYVDSSFSVLRPDYSNDPPLLYVLVRPWYALVRTIPGVTAGSVACDYWLRLLPCILGIAGIALTFLAGRHILQDNESALIAALLFAISPFQIYYAQELRPYSLYVALSLGTLIFFLKALKENRAWNWVALAVCLALSVYAQFFSLWNLAAMNIYFAATFKSHGKLTAKWVLCQCAALLVCVPALILAYNMQHYLARAQEHWFPRPDLRTPLITFKNFFAGYTPNYRVYRAIFAICAAFLLLGIHALRRRRNALLLIAVLAFVPIAGNLVLWRISSTPFYTHRLMIFSAVPCYVLVAVGMRTFRKAAFTIIAVALLAGLTVPCLADHYSHRLHPSWHHRLGVRYKVQNREAAHYIARNMAEGDYVGHASHFTLCPFNYYLSAQQSSLGFTEEERTGLLRGHGNARIWDKLGFFPVRIESVTDAARRIWFVDSWWEPLDPHPLVRQLRGWLDGHCIREERKPFDGLTVYLYRNDPKLKTRTRTCQLADYGDFSKPYYIFPRDKDGLSAEMEWKQRFLRGSLSEADERPSAYEAQFDLPIAHEGELPIYGRTINADFIDEDGDGQRETLLLANTGARLREGTITRVDSVDYSLLALDGDMGRAVLASFPLQASDDFTYRFLVRNTSEAPRTVRCSVYESAHLIDPLSFNRSGPQSDVWRPTLQYNNRPPPELFNKPAMVARLTDKSSGASAIYTDVRLDPGHYAVFARIIEEANPVNQSRATLRFTAIPSTSSSEPKVQDIGTLEGNNPSGTFGWTWRRVGEFDCDGRPFRFVVTALNEDSLPKAYFDLGRVMFVRAEDSTASRPSLTERFDVVLAPFERKAYTISSSLGDYQTKRVDIELFDTFSGEFRNLFFYVRRETTTNDALAAK